MRACALFLALAALACAASAARVTPDLVAISQEDLAQAGSSSGALQHWINTINKGDKGSAKAYVAFRYFVHTDEKQDFIQAWQELEKSTAEEKGNLIYDLKKPLTNNYQMIGYGEWHSFKDFMRHLESDYVQQFMDKLMKHDVAFTIEPLLHPDVAEVKPSKEQEDDKQQAHVLIRYHVPPSANEKFLDAWNEAARGTEKEKGAHIYSLRKVWSDNTHYYAYGTWDSMADYRDHFKCMAVAAFQQRACHQRWKWSDHVRKLRDTLDKEGVVWSLSPLEKMGSQPE